MEHNLTDNKVYHSKCFQEFHTIHLIFNDDYKHGNVDDNTQIYTCYSWIRLDILYA